MAIVLALHKLNRAAQHILLIINNSSRAAGQTLENFYAMVQVESFHLIWLHFDLYIKDSSFVTSKMVYEDYLNPHEHSSFLFLRFFSYLNSHEESFAYFKGTQLVQIQTNAILNFTFQFQFSMDFLTLKRC